MLQLQGVKLAAVRSCLALKGLPVVRCLLAGIQTHLHPKLLTSKLMPQAVALTLEPNTSGLLH